MVFPFLLTDTSVGTLVLVPLGKIDAHKVESVRRALARTFEFEVRIAHARPLPHETYYSPRRRYRADHLVAWLARHPAGDKTIGVTDRDISTSAHGRKDWGVAGLGLIGGNAAIVSSFRAKGSLEEVAIHEVGHTLGLPHCPHPGCLMRDANGKIARIGVRFCATCRAKIDRFVKN